MAIFSAVLLLLTLWIYSYLFKSKGNLEWPRGPIGIPIFGHLPWMILNPGRKWSQSYGPVFPIQFGSFRTLVLNDVSSIKEAFRVNSLNGRPPIKFIKDVNENKGITMADEASEQRQFIVQSMRKFALQTQTVEFYINNEITHIMRNLEEHNGHVMKIANVLDIATINGIWARIMTGHRFESSDKILNLLENLSKISGSPSVLNGLGFAFPWVAKWLPNLTGHNRMVETFNELHAEVAGILNVHMKTRCSGSPRDIVDAYFDKVEQMTEDSSTFHMTQAQATVTFSDIFVGATETINGTMEWILLFLARHQLMQKRLHAEIIEVIGNSPPSLSDRSRLPYTEAVQHEVLRLCPTLPLGVGHYSLEETKFLDFLVPKGTMLISNIYGIHHNSKLWGEDVESFRPERFLSNDGTFQKSPYFLAFGAGKRSCPGEHWAKDLLFLYVTRIFQKFHIQLDNNFLNYSEGTFGVTLRTKPFYVKLTSYDFLEN